MLLAELKDTFEFLAEAHSQHARSSAFYRFMDPVVKHAIAEAKNDFMASHPVPMAEIGTVVLPYLKMGAIDSLDLFGLDELMLFAFYYRNRARYKRAIDIGGNLGLHTIMLAKCGFQVETYEPDPFHYEKLMQNLALNHVEGQCEVHRAAISNKDGSMEFVRVLGNTTGSHLAGAKANPYGDLERFAVDVRDIKTACVNADLAKIDAEGHETVILTAIPMERWGGLDAFVEIGTPENAALVFEHFNKTPVHIFSQKTGWKRVQGLEQMPTSYQEGGIFISRKDDMPW